MHAKEIYRLSEALGEQCIENGYLLVTAESCTGGLLAQSITDIPGSSLWFDRGFVTYSNESKVDCLAISPLTLDAYGSVSQETANEMAVGAISSGSGNLSISISGIAGPDGGSKLKPVGTVFFAISNKKSIIFKYHANFHGDRSMIRNKALLFILNTLLKLTLNPQI
tara:strand:- start:30 stop:530 length:501 start_codon:yes stop_codon:yes gene_type:complete